MQNEANAQTLAHRLAPNESLAIGLLQEEIKALRFYNDLEQVGFEYTFYRPDLSRYILTFAGFATHDDALLEHYYALLIAHLDTLEPTEAVVHAVAVDVYRKLGIERQRRGGDTILNR